MIPYKEVQNRIVRQFEGYLIEYNKPMSNKEEILASTYEKYLVLLEMWVFSKKANQIMNEMFKLHTGFTLIALNRLSEQKTASNYQADKITEIENEAVEKYYKLLYKGKREILVHSEGIR